MTAELIAGFMKEHALDLQNLDANTCLLNCSCVRLLSLPEQEIVSTQKNSETTNSFADIPNLCTQATTGSQQMLPREKILKQPSPSENPQLSTSPTTKSWQMLPCKKITKIKVFSDIPDLPSSPRIASYLLQSLHHQQGQQASAVGLEAVVSGPSAAAP